MRFQPFAHLPLARLVDQIHLVQNEKIRRRELRDHRVSDIAISRKRFDLIRSDNHQRCFRRKTCAGARDLRDASRIADTAGFDDDMIRARIQRERFRQRVDETTCKRAAHTTVAQADSGSAALRDQRRIDLQIAKVVDQHRNATAFSLREQRVQQSGLAGTQKAADDGQRHSAWARHVSEPLRSGRRFERHTAHHRAHDPHILQCFRRHLQWIVSENGKVRALADFDAAHFVVDVQRVRRPERDGA